MNPLIQNYINNAIAFLKQTTDAPEYELRKFVESTVKHRFADLNVFMLQHEANGEINERHTTLHNLLAQRGTDVLTPNGCIYTSSDKQLPPTTPFILEKSNERDKHKKAMLVAESKGDKRTAALHYNAQTLIKINMNSLPGGMASPYNPFYDKAGYNAITAMARSLVTVGYTSAEQSIGGNFTFTTQDEIINWIIINLQKIPDVYILREMYEKYQLPLINSEQLLEYYKSILQQFRVHEITALKSLLESLSQPVLTYFYYLGNLYNCLRSNKELFQQKIHELFDWSHIDITGIDPSAVLDIPTSMQHLMLPHLIKELDGLNIYELPTKRPAIACKITAIAYHIRDQLKWWNDLFKYIILNKVNIPSLHLKKQAPRVLTTTSDTDSAILTLISWALWYTGDPFNVKECYKIVSLIIYWFAYICKNELRMWSKKHGAADNNLSRMVMKNEFIMPRFLLFDIKKAYVALTSIQEGILLPNPKVDVKGGILRGSSIPVTVVNTLKEILLNDILSASMSGKINGMAIIKKVVAFERHILKSIKNREMEFLDWTSIRQASEYDDSYKTAWRYWYLWEQTLAQKYEHIHLPGKMPLLPLLKSMPPINAISKYTNAEQMFINKYYLFHEDLSRKHTPTITLNPELTEIPEELMTFINIDDILLRNITPIYRVLETINLAPPFYKQRYNFLHKIYLEV